MKPKCRECLLEVDKDTQDFVKTSQGYFHKECKEKRELRLRQVKCHYCGELLDKISEEAGKDSQGYYHKTCKEVRAIRMVKCKICGLSIDRQKEDFEKIGRSYAHKKCYEDKKNVTPEGKVKCYYCGEFIDKAAAVKDEKKRNFHPECLSEQKDRELLFEYCCALWGLKAPGPTISSQAKNFRKKGYTYKGMIYSLKYFYEVKKNDVGKYKGSETIGIIPYVYQDAEKYYYELAQTKKAVTEDLKTQIKKEIQTIRIKKENKVDTLYEF